jgi:squalene-associated FAD-dependent desaturase
MTSTYKPPPPHIVIVGGGLAGLAVASCLVDRGLRITLLESRPRLGGRASSFNDPVTGEFVDNCQHVSMACCTNLADFCQRVGIDTMLRREPALVFLSPEGRVSRLQAGPGPAPFHLAGSFLSASFLSTRDKLQVAYGLACLAWGHDERPGESVADWLSRHRQGLRAINLFWATVLISALNERLDQMDVGHARKVFLDGFLRNRTGFQLELPLVPLGELYGTRLERWLGDHEVAVRLTTGVRVINYDDENAALGVVLRSGETLTADFVVLAVPFDRVRGLIPDALIPRLPALAQLDLLKAAPITGIHLWFDRSVCPFDHVVTPGRLIQWVFNHTAIQGRSAAVASDTSQTGLGQYLQLVISASYDLLALDKIAIRDAVLNELAEIWPAARSAQLLRWWVVTEHGATFAVRPGVEAHRPPQRTQIDGLFLAGDWTNTGWPATMEGAVRSGYLAAQEILADLDRPTRLICPELKPGSLARWLFSL